MNNSCPRRDRGKKALHHFCMIENTNRLVPTILINQILVELSWDL